MNAKDLVTRTALSSTLFALVLVFSSCVSSQADGKVDVVGPREAATLVESDDHVVVDLRSAEAHAAGHVAGAVNLPYLAGDFQEQLTELDPDQKYLLYSHDPQIADEAADVLVSLGFTQVVDAGAFGLLALAGAPVE